MKERFWNPFHALAAWSWLMKIRPPRRWPAISQLASRTKDSTIWMRRLRPSLLRTPPFPLLQSWRRTTHLVPRRSFLPCTPYLEREPDPGGASDCHAQHGDVYRRRGFDRLVARHGLAGDRWGTGR